VKNLEAIFLNHNCPNPPFLIGWKAILDKIFKNLPTGYTNNYFFEFQKGKVIVKHLFDSDTNESWLFDMNIIDAELPRVQILDALFGSKDLHLILITSNSVCTKETISSIKSSCPFPKSISLFLLNFSNTIPKHLKVCKNPMMSTRRIGQSRHKEAEPQDSQYKILSTSAKKYNFPSKAKRIDSKADVQSVLALLSVNAL
jgi:hypothetical protein